MTESAIKCENLKRDFGSVRALDGLSLEVPGGIIFGFLGPNGAGKTTTIRTLLGLLEPTSGRAQVMGYDTRTQADQVRANSGVLLEHNGIYEHLSAEDNLEFYGRVNNMSANDRQARIKELLTQFGLWERRKETAKKWSEGMKQKLAIARAVLHHPPLILLDEPTAGLDVMAAITVRDDLASLAKSEGITIFLTTHNMVEAERLCAQVAVIRKGRVLAVGDPNELRAREGGQQVEITGKGLNQEVLGLVREQPWVVAATSENDRMVITLQEGEDSAPLVNILVEAGVQVSEVRKGIASLEETFVTLMEEGND